MFAVQRDNSVSPPGFEMLRDVDVSEYLGEREELLHSMLDSKGNIWFTARFILGQSVAENGTTVGYITPTDEVHVGHLRRQAMRTAS